MTLDSYATQIISKVLPFRGYVGTADGIIGVQFGRKDRVLYQKKEKKKKMVFFEKYVEQEYNFFFFLFLVVYFRHHKG